MTSLKIAIVSDLHCRHSQSQSLDQVSTYLTSDLIGVSTERHPVRALKKLIREIDLTADILLCPGDITDKSDKQGLISGWAFLKEIQAALGAETLAATLGNHDVCSRGGLSLATPFDLVRDLGQDFPTPDKAANQKFWAEHFCILESVNSELLIINSVYSHLDEKAAHNCVISKPVTSAILAELLALKDSGKRKICLLHHHPIHHSNMNYKDSDFVDGGDALIKVLSENGFDIIIHGHKHDPRLTIHQDIPVFAVGSFSSLMNVKDIGAENTFHVITFPEKLKKGIIDTWVFGPTKGWKQKLDTYFPCVTGFGSNADLEQLANTCNMLSDNKPVRYSKLVENIPELQYLTPVSQLHLSEILRSKHKLVFNPELPNTPTFLAPIYF